jgi:hypothetical protein
MGLVAGDLILNLQDPVLVGCVIVDVVASDPPVIFCFDLAERTDTCRPVPGRIEWIRP